MRVWTPRFACPECGGYTRHVDDSVACIRCGRCYERRDGIWRFLTPARAEAIEPFARQYRVVRARDGHRVASSAYCRGLPSVARDDPHAAEWRLRGETYRHLLESVLAAGPARARAIDLGAGNAWL